MSMIMISWQSPNVLCGISDNQHALWLLLTCQLRPSVVALYKFHSGDKSCFNFVFVIVDVRERDSVSRSLTRSVLFWEFPSVSQDKRADVFLAAEHRSTLGAFHLQLHLQSVYKFIRVSRTERREGIWNVHASSVHTYPPIMFFFFSSFFRFS